MLRLVLSLLLLLALAFHPADPVYEDILLDETATQLIVKNQRMSLAVDKATGSWTTWNTDGLDGSLLTPQAAQPALDFSINGTYQIARYGSRLLRREISIDKDRRGVTLAITSGIRPTDEGFAYELTQAFRIFPGDTRLERTARLRRNHPGPREHFDGFRFQVPGAAVGAPAQNRLTVPGPFFTHTFVAPATPYDSLKTRKINFHSAPDAGFGLLVLDNPTVRQTLGSWMNTGGEVAYHTAIEGDGRKLTLRHDDKRAYYLTPGMAVESDVQHLSLRQSPDQVLADYRAVVGQTMPVDARTPDWVQEQVILEIYPKYFKGGLTELKARLPFYKNVGFTMIYLMPHWTGGYSPLDPFALEPKFGKPEDLKALVQEAHRLGLKVIFDMVIHVFNRKSPLPKQRPELFVRNEGDTLAYHPTWKSVTTDWAAPAYQQYMVDLVLHDQRTYGNDGYRVDAATYKGAGWNPRVPYPAYRDGSAAPELMTRMLTALRKHNPESVLLSEVFGPVFYSVCNFVHDNQTEAVPLLLEKMAKGQYTAADYKAHIANVYAALPAGANRVFYARNHDTDWFYTFGGYTPRFMAFESVHALFGIPEAFAGDPDYPYNPDEKPEIYETYRRLFSFRRQNPIFIRGEMRLADVQCSNNQIFSGLRRLNGRSALALISFSERPEEAVITLKDATSLPVLKDLQTGQVVPAKATGKNAFTVRLAPFQRVAATF